MAKHTESHYLSADVIAELDAVRSLAESGLRAKAEEVLSAARRAGDEAVKSHLMSHVRGVYEQATCDRNGWSRHKNPHLLTDIGYETIGTDQPGGHQSRGRVQACITDVELRDGKVVTTYQVGPPER